ncbi:MAG: isopenicillin-N epimerase [Chloroflexota bacterium]|nr:isopenicillin-N epimerase [Chloroflexota bacterium]
MNPELGRHWALDPELAFLNHGSFGATPHAVLQAQRWLRELIEWDPVRFLDRFLPGRLAAAREVLAAVIGADAEDLVFLPNATTGINVVLRSVRETLRPGDELLTTDHEYNATLNALEVVARAAGARVVVANVPFPLRSADDVVEAVLARVTPRTRLAMLSWITSATAVIFPVERLARELSARGVDVLIDGAHAPGQIPVDLSALAEAGVAYVAANGHKWLCGPKGSAFLWVRRDRQADVHPLVVSHGANAPLQAGGRSRFQLEFDWPGTADPTPYLALATAIDFLAELEPGGMEQVMAANHAMVLEGRSILEAALGQGPADHLAPDDLLGSMATIAIPDDLDPRATDPLPDADPDVTLADDPLNHDLVERDRIQVPVYAWPARPALGPSRRFLRISAQRYNDLDDYRRLADGLARRAR